MGLVDIASVPLGTKGYQICNVTSKGYDFVHSQEEILNFIREEKKIAY